MTFDEKILKKITEFEEALSLYVSPHTRRAYIQDIKEYISFQNEYHSQLCTLETFQTLTVQDVRSWLSHRQKTHNLRSTVRSFSSLKKFFLFLKKNLLIESSPFFIMRPPRLHKLLPKALSVEQAFDVIENINVQSKQNWVGLRDKAFFTLIYSVGLRINEAINLNQNILKKNYFVVFGKGNKERTVPLIDKARESIREYIKVCPFQLSDKSPLFYGSQGKRLNASVAQRTLRNYRNDFLLPEHTTPHAFRHSCASHLIDKSDDIRTVQELLGHASLSTTQIYTQISQEKLLRTYNSAHPRSKKN